jgi:hypothetical protein
VERIRFRGTWALWFALVWSALCSGAITIGTWRARELARSWPQPLHGAARIASALNYRLILLPVLGALIASLPWPVRIRREMQWLGLLLLMSTMVLGVFSIGILHLPAGFALFVVATERPG